MDSLDGLRGFAALIVVLSHTSNVEMYFLPFLDFRGVGKSGVYLFFLLSAFLLTLPLLRQGNKIFTRQFMSHYWQRRFFRIYPLFALYLLIALVSSYILLTFLDKKNIGLPFHLDLQSFFSHLFLQEGKGVTWSIAVEFKFYFILPFFAYLFYIIQAKSIKYSVIIVCVALVLYQVLFTFDKIELTQTSVLPYIPIFLIGMLLAVFQHAINEGLITLKYKKTIKILGYIGFVGVSVTTPFIYTALFEFVPNNYFHKEYILITICWAMILFSAANIQGIIQVFFALPFMRFFGAISFSLYLFHPIFIDALRFIKMETGFEAWVVLGLSIITAYISFKLIEEPSARFKVIK
tara:strand:+ start:3534 stop:4580 length:1047 start_codon:yes stop_codon:yes gene_type:complete